MDPLNKQERTEAFIKMIILFILTVIIVSVPMYYVFRLPLKELAYEKSEHEKLALSVKEEKMSDMEFLALADSARSLFVQITNEGVAITRERLSGRFSEVLNEMEDYSVREEDTIRSDLYDHVIVAFNDLFTKVNNIKELREELKQSSLEKKEPKETKTIQLTDDEKLIELIKSTLEKYNGNKREAAKELGMTERRLKKKMEELGM